MNRTSGPGSLPADRPDTEAVDGYEVPIDPADGADCEACQ